MGLVVILLEIGIEVAIALATAGTVVAAKKVAQVAKVAKTRIGPFTQKAIDLLADIARMSKHNSTVTKQIDNDVPVSPSMLFAKQKNDSVSKTEQRSEKEPQPEPQPEPENQDTNNDSEQNRSDDSGYPKPGTILEKRQRLKIYVQKLTKAPPAKNADEAMQLITDVMDEVEDAYSGVEAVENPGLKYEGRMYAPRKDYTKQLPDGSLEAITSGNIVKISPQGDIRFFVRNKDNTPGALIFEKLGAGS